MRGFRAGGHIALGAVLAGCAAGRRPAPAAVATAAAGATAIPLALRTAAFRIVVDGMPEPHASDLPASSESDPAMMLTLAGALTPTTVGDDGRARANGHEFARIEGPSVLLGDREFLRLENDGRVSVLGAGEGFPGALRIADGVLLLRMPGQPERAVFAIDPQGRFPTEPHGDLVPSRTGHVEPADPSLFVTALLVRATQYVQTLVTLNTIVEMERERQRLAQLNARVRVFTVVPDEVERLVLRPHGGCRWQVNEFVTTGAVGFSPCALGDAGFTLRRTRDGVEGEGYFDAPVQSVSANSLTAVLVYEVEGGRRATSITVPEGAPAPGTAAVVFANALTGAPAVDVCSRGARNALEPRAVGVPFGGFGARPEGRPAWSMRHGAVTPVELRATGSAPCRGALIGRASVNPDVGAGRVVVLVARGTSRTTSAQLRVCAGEGIDDCAAVPLR